MGSSESREAVKLVRRGNVEALRKLLAKRRVDINCMLYELEGLHSIGNNTLLRIAVSTKRRDVAKLLLEHGADPEIADGAGLTPLHDAVITDDQDMLSLLLSHKADADAVNAFDKTPLASAKSAQVAQLLLDAGADINRKDEKGATTWSHIVDRFADKHDRSCWDVAEVLIRYGANINHMNENGDNALHVMASRRFVQDGIVKRLVGLGAELNGRNKARKTPLHIAAQQISSFNIEGEREEGRVSSIECLLNAGADINVEDEKGYQPFQYALIRVFSNKVFPKLVLGDLQAMVFHGAKWDGWCDSTIRYFATKPPHLPHVISQDVTRAVRLSVERWMADYAMGSEATTIPEEEVIRGFDAVQTYLNKLALSKFVILRRKICVVGPSNWGKTSMVKSIVFDQRSLVHPDDRTIGIDKFKLSFDQNVPTGDAVVHHEVTFWDFAGQDEYQVAHSLFFSRRTLYLVCIDLHAYAITFMQALLMTDDVAALDLRMNWYVEVRILRWIRLIIARQPDAEFRFVGTKNDSMSASDEDALEDLQLRLSNVLVIVSDMQRALGDSEQSDKRRGTGTQITHLGDERLASMKSKSTVVLMVSSCLKTDSVAVLKQWIMDLISSSRRSYPMPDIYSTILRLIKKMRVAAGAMDASRRIQASFVNANQLIDELTEVTASDVDSNAEPISKDECRIILQALRDLGDVLWYDDFDDAMLRETVILDPLLLIDFIRQIFNHNEKSEVMRHAKLKELLLWKNLDAVQMLAMKRVLQHFHLAYPTEKEMQVDSDLLMPAFWRSKKSAQWLFLGQPLKHPTTAKPRDWSVTVHWEIHMDYGFEDVLFDRLVVASYNSSYLRVVGPDYLLYGDIKGEKVPYALRLIADWHRTTHKRVLHLEAVLDDEAKAAAALWARFECVCLGLSAVFKTFPGLRVSICARQPSEEEGDGYDRPLLRTCTTPDSSWLPPEPTLTKCRELLTNY